MADNTPALADLASQINAEHEACHAAMRESTKHAVRAGACSSAEILWGGGA